MNSVEGNGLKSVIDTDPELLNLFHGIQQLYNTLVLEGQLKTNSKHNILKMYAR